MSAVIHLLLVEDSDKDAALILRELHKAGINVVSERVDNAEALQRTLKARQWDIVFADHEMPSFDAFHALEMVRENDPEISFVVVSGTIGDELAVNAMRAGAQDYVMKDHLARLGAVVKREIVETKMRRERAQAITALRETEARKAAILETALDAVITMDHLGNVVDLNPAAESIFGYQQEEAIGKELAALIIPPRLREAHRNGLSRYLSTEKVHVLGGRMEVPAMRKDGSEFPAEVAITRIRRPGPPMFTGYVRDVTDRKRLETRQWLLAEAGAKLVKSLNVSAILQDITELAVGHIADWCAIDLLDHRGVLQQTAAAARSTGLPEKPMPNVRSRFTIPEAIVLRTVRQGKPFMSPTTSPSAHESYILTPMLVRGGALGVMSLILAPGQRAFDRDALDLAVELSARCAMAVDNARLFHQVLDSVQVRDDFIAIAAHELRTPLTPLRIHAQLLAEKFKDNREALTPERLAPSVLGLLHSADRFDELVERLLGFSQVTVGGIHLKVGNFDLVRLTEEVVENMEGSLKRSGSTVIWDVPQSPVMGQWDPHQVKLAIREFVINAMKFGPGKPIQLTIDEDIKEARLTISDQGSGLSPEDQARIFERYRRPASIKHYGGFGLGLWIVQRVAEAHGGHVDVKSEVGKGATFTLALPQNPVTAIYG